MVVHVILHLRDNTAEIRNKAPEDAGFVHPPEHGFGIARRGEHLKEQRIGGLVTPHAFVDQLRIAGGGAPGQRVLLVEDLTTDGRSKVNFCNALREAGAIVEHIFVIFYYGIYPESEKILTDLGIKLHHLCTWWDVLAEARAQGSFDAATLTEVESFLSAPREWQESRKPA